MPKTTSGTRRLPSALRLRIEGANILARPSPGLGDFVTAVEIVELLRLIDAAASAESSAPARGAAGRRALPQDLDGLYASWCQALDEARANLPSKKDFRALLADLEASGMVLAAPSEGAHASGGEGRFADGWIQWAMLADDNRLHLYEQAIARTLRRGSVALDVGAGTGALTHLLLKHGAKRVLAIEESAVAARIVPTLRRLDPKLATERITVIPRAAADAGRELHGEKIDLVVSELFGNDPFCEGVVPTLRAVQQSLPAAARSIPQRVRVKCQMAQLTPTVATATEGGGGGGPSGSALLERLVSWNRARGIGAASTPRPHTSTTENPYDAFRAAYAAVEDWSTLSFAYPLRRQDFQRMGPELEVFDLNLAPVPAQKATRQPRTTSFRFPPLSDRSFLMMWFEVDLCPGITLTSCPGEAHTCQHWSPVLMPLTHGPKPGLPAEMRASLDADECHLALTLRAGGDGGEGRPCAAR